MLSVTPSRLPRVRFGTARGWGTGRASRCRAFRCRRETRTLSPLWVDLRRCELLASKSGILNHASPSDAKKECRCLAAVSPGQRPVFDALCRDGSTGHRIVDRADGMPARRTCIDRVHRRFHRPRVRRLRSFLRLPAVSYATGSSPSSDSLYQRLLASNQGLRGHHTTTPRSAPGPRPLLSNVARDLAEGRRRHRADRCERRLYHHRRCDDLCRRLHAIPSTSAFAPVLRQPARRAHRALLHSQRLPGLAGRAQQSARPSSIWRVSQLCPRC